MISILNVLLVLTNHWLRRELKIAFVHLLICALLICDLQYVVLLVYTLWNFN